MTQSSEQLHNDVAKLPGTDIPLGNVYVPDITANYNNIERKNQWKKPQLWFNVIYWGFWFSLLVIVLTAALIALRIS